ncbi:MAG: Short-chain alcohol dehydrogenase [Gemmatimonadetes bacterium]|nr:Short-chain alcohol dehydrogenase [Gemmatimonadota bacterium]
MIQRLDGTVALVTGASSGIGAATAMALVAEGAAVALVARRKERLDQLVKEITTLGGRAIAIEGDVSRREQAEAAVAQAVKQFARLDILVNNAGVMLLGPAADAPVEEWDRMIDVNLKGLLYCAHAGLPHLVSAAANGPRGVADMVNISSTAGRVPRAGTAVYNLTKFGVGAFSEALRQEVTKQHVRVALVEPGAVKTELVDHVRSGVREGILERFSHFERLEAEDIADAIVYIVTRQRRVAVNEMLIRPTEQEY